MRKTTVLFIILGLIRVGAFAQDSTGTTVVIKKDTAQIKRYFLGVSGGYSLMMGNLVGINYSDPKSGFASLDGYNVGADGAYYFNKYIGIGGVVSFSSYYVSQAGLTNLAYGYQQSFGADSAKAAATTKYNFYNFFLGPYFSIPFKNKKTTIDIRAVGGLTYVRTAEFDIVVINLGVPHPFAQNISQAIAWGGQAGIGLRHELEKNLCLKINVDYYYTNPTIGIINSNMPTNVRELTTYHQPIMMLHFNVGLAYKFGM
ncbi:MAG: hypothetical protein ACYDCN_06645 [Bacteroidia bacterium]